MATVWRSLRGIPAATPLGEMHILHRPAKHRPQELRARLLPKCRLLELGKPVISEIASHLGFSSSEAS